MQHDTVYTAFLKRLSSDAVSKRKPVPSEIPNKLIRSAFRECANVGQIQMQARRVHIYIHGSSILFIHFVSTSHRVNKANIRVYSLFPQFPRQKMLVDLQEKHLDQKRQIQELELEVMKLR